MVGEEGFNYCNVAVGRMVRKGPSPSHICPFHFEWLIVASHQDTLAFIQIVSDICNIFDCLSFIVFT